MIPAEIQMMEARLKQILADMFRNGKFDEVRLAMQETFDRLPLGSGHYQLLMKSQTMGFGQSGDVPATVNVLGVLSTAIGRDPKGSSRVSVGYGPVDLSAPKPCSHCKGSGMVLDRSSQGPAAAREA